MGVFGHQTAIHAQGFRSLAEGDEVEIDERQRKKAHNVTGPDGAFVLGAPRPDTNYGFGGGGGGSSFGGDNSFGSSNRKSFNDDDDDFNSDFGGPKRGKPDYGKYGDDDDDKW